MKTLTIVLPCYNEEEALPLYFKAVDPIIKTIENYKVDFVLVNDGSKDKTLEVMNQLYTSRDDITIVSFSRNFGQNPALSAGLHHAKGDYVIMMDVDLQDPVELIVDICNKFDEGYEVVSPHRSNRKEDSWFKRTTAKMFYKFINKLEKKEVIPENVNCFRGLSRRAVDAINALEEKDKLLINEIPLVGFKTCQIDFIRAKRVAGKSKYQLDKLFTHAFNVISSGTTRPLYFPIKFGALTSCFNLVAFLTFLVFFILGQIGTVNAFAYQWVATVFITSAVLLGMSLIIFFIGIVSLFLHNILINTRNRPTYIVDQVCRPEDK